MSYVKAYEERTIIPTYGIGEPDKNPMFYENRVYQGSSGKVYPLPVIDTIYDDKHDKAYNAVYIENEYIKVMILPELGGRIQRAYDKTNGYDFVYYNHVVKPALVGLAGPWISGGIEFNWPQHHRPSTFMPVDYKIEHRDDGSCTIWCNEIDKMYGTKALMGITLHPDHAYIEITGQLYNPTDIPQTFLWWANPAVAVNDDTKSIFPPDVHAVFDHGKRDVSEFPIAKGEYYKVDYSPGTDISRYKNIPVPTSYMAFHSDYNFVGGYDFGVEAGVLHVANHHISPGKKQWTWGNGEFGQAWDRHLTDENGPYIELMTGVYTDNQPDFTWLEPGEEKFFTQYFMPYKTVGEVKNASKDILIGLDVNELIDYRVYASTVFTNVEIEILVNGKLVHQTTVDTLDPNHTVKGQVPISKTTNQATTIRVLQGTTVLIEYTDQDSMDLPIPDPAKKSEDPKDIKTNEELFLTGLHLEQYRHATYRPDPYYLEGLERDPGDIRINNAYGLLLYRRGLYQESAGYFETAKERLLWKNPNPYSGDVLYHLGLSYKMQGRLQEAYDVLYKSVWNDAMQAKGYYQLALIQARDENYRETLRLIELSLLKGSHNLNARLVKTIALRQLGQLEEARKHLTETLSIDPLDYGALFEQYLLSSEEEDKTYLVRVMRAEPNSYLELVIRYIDAGQYEHAIEILQLDRSISAHPMVLYYIGYSYQQLGNKHQAASYYSRANEADSAYCFPNKLPSILVLEDAIKTTPHLPKAYYYLGNLYYDKLVPEKAITLWEQSRQLDDRFPTVHRNLGLAYYNKHKDIAKARESLEQAFALDTTDARVCYELDQLYKRINLPHKDRHAFMMKHVDLVKRRDDFYVEYVSVCNQLGEFETALDLLLSRQFHVWEGGEGRVVEQYVYALKQLANNAIRKNDYQTALDDLQRAKVYPHNLGEGKLINAQENDINYYIAVCLKELGQPGWEDTLKQATIGVSEPTAAMFYNDAKPDSIFFQGLAYQALGHTQQANDRFEQMIAYGKAHMNDKVRVDYFAISLPNFLIYEENLIRNNTVHCHYLQGLGYLGQRDLKQAKIHFDKALSLDSNHQGIRYIQSLFEV